MGNQRILSKSKYLGEINNKYPKSKHLQFIKLTSWIIPCVIKGRPTPKARTLYTGANKLGMGVIRHEKQSNSKLYTILTVLLDFPEPLNIITASQYAERFVLVIDTAKFIPDNSDLTLLFIQLQQAIRNRNYQLYITYIWSHTGLPHPLAQGKEEIDQLLKNINRKYVRSPKFS